MSMQSSESSSKKISAIVLNLSQVEKQAAYSKAVKILTKSEIQSLKADQKQAIKQMMAMD